MNQSGASRRVALLASQEAPSPSNPKATGREAATLTRPDGALASRGPANFRLQFKRFVGTTPSAYRRTFSTRAVERSCN